MDGRELKGVAMRARLREATEGVIAEMGIDATTTVEIARRCGVSRGALLHHYPTRDELIIDTARHFWRRSRDNVAALADDVREGRAGVGIFIGRLYDEVFPARSLVTMLELMVGGRSDTAIGRAVVEVLTDLFRAYEELGELAFRSHGLPPAQVHAAMTLIVSTLRGLRIQEILDPDHDISPAVRALLVDAVEGVFAKAPRVQASARKVQVPARRGVRKAKN